MTGMTHTDLVGAFACYVAMWGVGYLLVEAKRSKKRKNLQPTTGENQP